MAEEREALEMRTPEPPAPPYTLPALMALMRPPPTPEEESREDLLEMKLPLEKAMVVGCLTLLCLESEYRGATHGPFICWFGD